MEQMLDDWPESTTLMDQSDMSEAPDPSEQLTGYSFSPLAWNIAVVTHLIECPFDFECNQEYLLAFVQS